MYFQALERVEFRDTDAAGIAHFSVFFNWMERAEHAFLRRLGFSVVQPTPEGKISWPRVSATCDYFRPIGFEQLFGVQIHVVRLGRSSCTYRFQFLSLDSAGNRSLAFEPHGDTVAATAGLAGGAGQGDAPWSSGRGAALPTSDQPFIDGLQTPSWISPRDWFADGALQPFAAGSLTAVCCQVEPGRPPTSIAIPEPLKGRLAEFIHEGEAQ